ncbi:MAG: hypothetical protein ACI4N3_01925 [Alphaproteobacteria bacterium]
MNNLNLFMPISFIPNEGEKKAFDEKSNKFRSIEELLDDAELMRAMALVNVMRKDRHLVDDIIKVINKIFSKAKLNIQVNDFANDIKLDREVAKLRKFYLSKQRELLSKNHSR